LPIVGLPDKLKQLAVVKIELRNRIKARFDKKNMGAKGYSIFKSGPLMAAMGVKHTTINQGGSQ
jgi:hypothetical protein